MPSLAQHNFQPDSFRYIDEGAALPENIIIIQASYPEEALASMFAIAATHPDVNFIVWNPTTPWFGPEDQQKLHSLRTTISFKVYGEYNVLPSHAAASENLILHTQIHGSHPEQDHIRHCLKELFKPRLRTLFNAAVKARKSDYISYQKMNYAANGGVSGLGQVVQYNSSRFHIDAAFEPYLRLLHCIEGPGTYLVSTKDTAYQIAKDGRIHGSLNNPDAIVWMLRPGAYVLMRSGGSAQYPSLPGLHSVPFENHLFKEGDQRVLERCDFKLSPPLCLT